MKKQTLYKEEYMHYFGVPVPDADFVPEKPKREVVETSSDGAQGVLQAIYAFDPVTRLPTGDIMCYMASTTPPELKEYILNNLMIDTSSQALPKLPDGIDEDTAFSLERHIDESLDSYRGRVQAYMNKQVELRDMALENAQRQATKPSE